MRGRCDHRVRGELDLKSGFEVGQMIRFGARFDARAAESSPLPVTLRGDCVLVPIQISLEFREKRAGDSGHVRISFQEGNSPRLAGSYIAFNRGMRWRRRY